MYGGTRSLVFFHENQDLFAIDILRCCHVERNDNRSDEDSIRQVPHAKDRFCRQTEDKQCKRTKTLF